MRDILAMLEGQRVTVQATVLRHSRRIGWAMVREPTILIGEVTTLEGDPLVDHVWLNVRKRLGAADLRVGDKVQFTARVSRYRRGMRREPDGSLHFSTEYGLGYPTHIEVLVRVPQPVPAPPGGSKAAQRRLRTLQMVVTLLQEQGEPPTLAQVLEAARANGANVLATATLLESLASSGTLFFCANGRIVPRATSTIGDQHPCTA